MGMGKPIARKMDMAICPVDGHDPAFAAGMVTIGSVKTKVGGMAVDRVGDIGMHSIMCKGPNTFSVMIGSFSVMVENKFVARQGDMTLHCGGMGMMATGYPKVLVG